MDAIAIADTSWISDRVPASVLPLTLERVSFAVRGKTLLEDISLILAGGKRTVILGPNGAGKSLLLRLCHGLLHPTDGFIRWADSVSDRARCAQAMVFQHPVLLRRSVAANVDYALSVRGIPRSQRKPLVAAILEQAGLSHLAKCSARVLSGGEQQRLALARAWSLKPQILFLDEPTSHLDPTATRAVEGMIDKIQQSGTKIVMTTHDLGQARRLADEVVFLHQGRVVEHSPAAAFFAKPKCAEAAAFLEGQLLW